MTNPTVVGLLYFLTTTLLALVIWGAKAIFTGDLVPKKSVDFVTSQWISQLKEKKAEAAEWKSHYEAERALGINSRENREILLAVSKTMDRVLGSLPTAKDADIGGK